LKQAVSDCFIVLSGCSGGGKSSLLDELRRRAYSVVEEPGRRIVQAELESGGRALPWLDLAAFARRAVELALSDLNTAATLPGWVFFDRGLVDAAAALEYATGEPALSELPYRYHPIVFLAPPWPEIFAADAERRHGLVAAVAEFDRLHEAYQRLGYSVMLLPQASVQARADFVLAKLAESCPSRKI
jgi:predicted ATPase